LLKSGDGPSCPRHAGELWWLWDEQDPSVHLSGFDPAVCFAGVLKRQDVGVKVDEALTDGF
jgi:hypothetical protein